MTKEFVEGMFASIDGRRWEELRDRFSPDAAYERPGYEPLVGLDAILDFYANVRVIVAGSHHLTRIVVEDGGGACWGRFVGKHRNGSDIDERFADVYTTENGKIKTRTSYFFRPAV
jgi:ketosteroid isomerase-like protein